MSVPGRREAGGLSPQHHNRPPTVLLRIIPGARVLLATGVQASMSRLCQASSRKKVKKVRTNGIAKSALGWVEYHAKQIPGPGEYDILDAVKKFKHKNRGVAKFTVGNPKSDIEW